MTKNLDLYPERLGQVAKTKRPERRGGWRGSEASLEALRQHRTRTQLGGPGVRTCVRCGRPAVKGCRGCMVHGGFAALWRQGRLQPNYRVNRRLKVLEREGQLDPELVRHPVWRAVRAKGSRASLLAREIVEAWTAGGAAWVAVLRKTKEAGLL